MRSSILLAVIMFLAVGLRAAEDPRQQYEAAKAAKDPAREQKALDAWKKARPDDPEYYIAAANALLNRGGGVNISKRPAGAGDFVIADPKTGKAVGSLGASRPSPDDNRAAIEFLKTGLAKAPGRIDIHLGIATLFHRLDDTKQVVATLTAMTEYAKAHPADLRGKNGAPYTEPVDELMAKEINGYAGEYFRSEDEKHNQAFHDLAKLDADAFPNRVYGHNLLGVYYTAIDKQPKLALASYERALKVAPEDTYVMVNAGELYVRTGDKQKAAELFQRVIDLNNDPGNVEQAKAQLAKLKEL